MNLSPIRFFLLFLAIWCQSLSSEIINFDEKFSNYIKISETIIYNFDEKFSNFIKISETIIYNFDEKFGNFIKINIVLAPSSGVINK